jgi:hypothetical protein
MAALASAVRGDRLMTLRDWLVSYGAAWIMPVPVGLAMLVLPTLYRWPFEVLGRAIPAENLVALIFGTGWIVLFAPMLPWIGLCLSVPLVWFVLRVGLGGWAVFALGGGAVGAVSGQILDGMHPLFPALIGSATALCARMILTWVRPTIFDTKII